MENYRKQDSPSHEREALLSRLCLKSSPLSLKAELIEAVMPLHQVIRYANQAAKTRTPVYICVEEELAPKRYQRTVLKGHFRSSVTPARQIMFVPSNQDILHLLSIDAILSIQKAA